MQSERSPDKNTSSPAFCSRLLATFSINFPELDTGQFIFKTYRFRDGLLRRGSPLWSSTQDIMPLSLKEMFIRITCHSPKGVTGAWIKLEDGRGHAKKYPFPKLKDNIARCYPKHLWLYQQRVNRRDFISNILH